MTSIVYASLIQNGFALVVTEPFPAERLKVELDGSPTPVRLETPEYTSEGVRYLTRLQNGVHANLGGQIKIRLGRQTAVLRLPEDGLVGALERVVAGAGTGWVVDVRTDSRGHKDCSLAFDGRPVPMTFVKRSDIEAIAPAGTGSAFRFEVPDWARDGEPHRIELRHGDRVLAMLDHAEEIAADEKVTLLSADLAAEEISVVLQAGSATAAGTAALTLSLNGVELGMITIPPLAGDGPARLSARQALGPLPALAALGPPASLQVRLDTPAGPGATHTLHLVPLAPTEPAWPPTVLQRGAKPLLLDAACIGSNALRLRLPGEDDDLAVVQWLHERPYACAVETIGTSETGRFATVTLASAYAPLLLVMRGPDQVIRHLDLLPFPSLCRGGIHHAELRAAAEGENDAAELPRLSAELLAGLLRRHTQPFDIALLLPEPTGNELSLARDLTEWLSSTMGATLRAVVTEAEAATAQLVIGGNAVPALSALATGPTPDAPLRPMPFAVVPSPGDVGPLWVASVPPLGPWFDALQPASLRGWYPRMCIAKAGDGAPAPLLAAITKGLPPSPGTLDLLFPVALGAPAEPAGAALPVNACIAVEAGSEAPELLLESLAMQDGVTLTRVVVATAGPPSATLTAKLETLFPNRHALIVLQPHARRPLLLSAATEQARGGILLLASGVVLHDPRCVAHLAGIAAGEQIGTVGCSLIAGQGTKLKLAAAGYELLSLSPSGSPAVAFRPAIGRQAPRAATVPVLANSTLLLCIRGDVLAALGGLAAARGPEAADVALGLAAIAAGRINVCVGALSAYALAAPRAGRVEMDLLGRMPQLGLGTLADTMLSWRQVN